MNVEHGASPARPPWWRRGPVLVWVLLLLLFGLLWGQHRLGVLHPSYRLFFLVLALFLLTALVTFARRLWRLAAGPDRPGALGGTLFTLLAVALFASPPAYSWLHWRTRHIPPDLAGLLGRMMGASFFEGAISFAFPNRLEGARLVMFYDELARPEEDLRLMEEHVAGMEKQLGRSLRAKVHWVRGRVLGLGGFAFYGLAFGSQRSPPNAASPEAFLDRHELAHAVLNQFVTPDSEPPTLLSEGWAEAQAGFGPEALARRALAVRRGAFNQPSYGVRDLTGPEWHHQDSGPVYPVGGAFVDFLLRKYGAEKFAELYVRCRPDRFEADCEAILGAGLDRLEQEFWQEAERLARPAP